MFANFSVTGGKVSQTVNLEALLVEAVQWAVLYPLVCIICD